MSEFYLFFSIMYICLINLVNVSKIYGPAIIYCVPILIPTSLISRDNLPQRHIAIRISYHFFTPMTLSSRHSDSCFYCCLKQLSEVQRSIFFSFQSLPLEFQTTVHFTCDKYHVTVKTGFIVKNKTMGTDHELSALQCYVIGHYHNQIASYCTHS